MSLTVSRRVWSATPEYIRGGAFTLLLALADYADDNGMCWPTIPTLAAKAHLGERQSTDLIKQLEQDGQVAVIRKAGRAGGMVFVVLTGLSEPEKVQSLHLLATEKVQSLQIKGAISAPLKVQSLQKSKQGFSAPASNEPAFSAQCNDHDIRSGDPESHASRARTADESQTIQSAPEPSPPPIPPAPPAPVAADQPRLLDTPDADPVAIYREVCKVYKPNQEQREAISAFVVRRLDLWREVCVQFRRNGWNVRAIDNLKDAYTKALATADRQDVIAHKAAEQQRLQSERPSLANQDREKLSAILREARTLRSESNGAANTV